MFLQRFGVLLAVSMLPSVNAASVSPQPGGNWSGYVVTGARNSVTDVWGSWIVPAATCSGSTASRALFWVGIDGYPASPTGTVEQIGTGVVCAAGTPEYYAWYEFKPNESTQKPIRRCPTGQTKQCITLTPGDTIWAKVSTSGSGIFTVTIKDIKTGQTFGKTETVSTAQQSSAEWIVEAPPPNLPPSAKPLANFGTVVFGEDNTGLPMTCSATINGQTNTIGNFPAASIVQLAMSNIEPGGGPANQTAAPSPLSSDGSSFVITAGIVSWWPADGNYDDVISDYNGTPSSSGVSFAPGELGQAFSLDGVSGEVDIPSSDALSPSSITLDAWVNPSTLSAAAQCNFKSVVAKYDNSPSTVSWIFGMLGGGQLNFAVYGGPNIYQQIETNDPVLVAGVWQHVAATFDSSTQAIHIYVNGVDEPSTLQPGSSPVTSLQQYNGLERIGATNASCGPSLTHWPGLIDEMSIYNRALAAQEILAIYNASKGS